MYDDGLHNDSLPNDNIYAYVFQNGFSNGDIIDYDFYLTDAGGNNSFFKGSFITIPTIEPLNEYLLEV